jgi:DNA-binding CsgD family transcriptional regulator
MLSSASTRETILRLCYAGLDTQAFRHQVMARLRRAIQLDAWCWPTCDPSTLLITGALAEGLPPETATDFFRLEYAAEDVNTFRELIRREPPVAGLIRATGGQLERSARWRELFGPLGFGDELRAALVRDNGCWGFLSLHRKADRDAFSPDEEEWLAGLTRYLADGLRASMIVERLSGPDAAGHEPAVIVLNGDLGVVTISDAAVRWMEDVEPADLRIGNVPSAVLAVAARLKRLEQGTDASPELLPKARVRGAAGRWATLQASPLGGDGHIAVIVDAARPSEVAPLVLRAYALSDREIEVAHLVLQGLSTDEMAAALFLSPHTVQQHLKAIFQKTDVHSRRELVARIFAEQHWPRIETGAGLHPDGALATDAVLTARSPVSE